jgi:FAD dependent oxidoreductase
MEQMTAHVIGIGAEPGGMSAGVAAVAEDAELVVIETLDHTGGNAVRSTAYLTFVHSEIQRRAGIADDEETFVADARSIVEQVQDRFSFIPKPRQHSIDGMAAVAEGWMLDRAFEPDFASQSVNTLFGTQTDRLVTNGGRVTGVRAQRLADGAEILVQAWGGLVLATGSYQSNPELRGRYQPALATARCNNYPNARLLPGRRGQPAGRRVARRSSRIVLAARHSVLPSRLPRKQLPISAPKRRSIGARRRCLHAHSVSLAIEQRRVLLPVQAETAVT